MPISPVMKILLLNPQNDAERNIVEPLKARGVAVLYSPDAGEAWQLLMLHGVSIELAIIHREGPDRKGEDGLKFIEKIKRDPSQADLPYIVTSELWGDPEFAEHQRGPLGANAYVHSPFDLKQMIALIEAVTEQKVGPASTLEAAPSVSFAPADALAPPPAPAESPLSFNLDEGAGLASPPPVAPPAPSYSQAMESAIIDIDPSVSDLKFPDPNAPSAPDDPFSLSNIESPARSAAGGYMPRFRGDAPLSPPSEPVVSEQPFIPPTEAPPIMVKQPEETPDPQSVEEMPYLYNKSSSKDKIDSPALALLQERLAH